MNLSSYDTYYYVSGEAGVPRVDLTFHVLGATRAAMTGGPMVAVEGELVPRLRASLHKRRTPATIEAILAGASGRQWQDELNEAGSGAMSIGNEDAQATLPREGDIIRFEDRGWACFSWVIREINRQQIAEGEEHDQVTDFSGEGLLSLLRDAVVYPSAGLEMRPIEETRYFSWQSNPYDDQWWATAKIVSYYQPGINQTPVGEPPESGMFGGITDWPDPGVAAISTNQGDYWLAPGGWCYLRKAFYIDDNDPVRTLMIYFACDDASMWWFDGQQVTTTTEWMNSNADLQFPTVEVSPGWHVIAVAVENSTLGPMWSDLFQRWINPWMLMCSVYRFDDNTGEPYGDPILRSDDTWKIVDYPPHPPGWTPGEVIYRAFLEAQTIRGGLPGIALGFTKETDSDGAPWPEVGDIGTKVGTDYFTFIVKELTETYIDVWMSPTLELRAWVKGTRGEHRVDVALHPPTDAEDPWSGNLAALSYKRVD